MILAAISFFQCNEGNRGPGQCPQKCLGTTPFPYKGKAFSHKEGFANGYFRSFAEKQDCRPRLSPLVALLLGPPLCNFNESNVFLYQIISLFVC